MMTSSSRASLMSIMLIAISIHLYGAVNADKYRQKRGVNNSCGDAYILTDSDRAKLKEMQNLTEGKLDLCSISYERREIEEKDAIPKFYYEAECAPWTRCCGTSEDGMLQTVKSNIMYLAQVEGKPTIIIKPVVIGCMCSLTLPSATKVSSAYMV